MANLHLGPGRAYIAPLGTPLDGPGWTDIGHLHGDGLIYEQEPATDGPLHVPCLLPMRPITGTFTARIRWTWSTYRWLFDHTSPRSSRVKRAYRRRRR